MPISGGYLHLALEGTRMRFPSLERISFTMADDAVDGADWQCVGDHSQIHDHTELKLPCGWMARTG